jgi:hypothetical protein
MTDHRRRPPVGSLPVVTAALGGFLILLTVLALQMRSGRDPALKPEAAAPPSQTILKRRIIKMRIIIFDAPKTNATGALRQAGSTAVARPSVTVSAPVAPVRPAPVASVPAPVTRTS